MGANEIINVFNCTYDLEYFHTHYYTLSFFNREQLISGGILGKVFLSFFAILSQHWDYV